MTNKAFLIISWLFFSLASIEGFSGDLTKTAPKASDIDITKASDEQILDQLANRLIDSSDSFYDSWVNFFHDNKAYEELYIDITWPLFISDSLEANYTPGDLEFVQDSTQIYMYHGTKATLEIFDQGKLVAHIAKCGRQGIFFGRDFSTSWPYAIGEASNIHKTWKNIPTSSVLVFKKEDSDKLESCNSGALGLVKEYYLRKQEYSLKNLVAILFNDKQDAKNFGKYLTDHPQLQKEYNNVKLYIVSYRPLTTGAVFRDFEKILKKNIQVLFNDPHFLSKLVEGFPKLLENRDFSIRLNSLSDSFSDAELKNLLQISEYNSPFPIFQKVLERTAPADLLAPNYPRLENALRSGDFEHIKDIINKVAATKIFLEKVLEIVKENAHTIPSGIKEPLANIIRHHFDGYPSVLAEKIRLVLQALELAKEGQK